MQGLHKGFVFIAASALHLPATATTVLPLAEIRTEVGDAYAPQFKTLGVSGLPALPKAALRATRLEIANTTSVQINGLGQGSFEITEPEYSFFENKPRADLLMVELPADLGYPANLSISDGSGATPLCTVTTDGKDGAVCLADIRSSLQASYVVDIESGASYTNLKLNWAGLLLGTKDGIVVTGPGHADAGAPIPIRMLAPSSTRIVPLPPATMGQRNFAAVLFGDDGTIGSAPVGVLPIAWTSSYARGDVNQPQNLLKHDAIWNTGMPRLGQLAPGQSATRLYFDLPPNSGAAYAPITVSLINDYYGAIDWYVERADFPEGSPAYLVDAAPLPPQVIHGSGKFTIEQPLAGRWYIVARNNGYGVISDNTIFLLSNAASSLASLSFDNVITPALAPGLYYNPARSGHGISLSQASGQQMLFWYTYLEDGTPTWYQAQAAAPAAGSAWWTAPLYRVAWDGKAHLTQVGDVLLTPTAENRFIFTWYLEDKAGSEVFVPLARSGDCPNLSGVSTNLNGAWYAPALSGYGMDVLALPEQQFNLLYLYDDLGIARWSVGNSLPFLVSTSMSFRQNTGFCPSCVVAPISSQAIGTVNIDYASDSTGNLATMLQLQPPLSGNWITDQPMRRLTGSTACVR